MSLINKVVSRFRAACRTNEPQAQTCFLLSIMMFLAALSNPTAPWWAVLGATLFWPTLAFIFNLIDPIP